jgi:putative two-component system response regulator
MPSKKRKTQVCPKTSLIYHKKTAPTDYEKKVLLSYKRLRRSYELIKDSYTEMIFRFALAAELKDESTGIHLVRMADYCTQIAKAYGLSKKSIYYLRYASPMHDIGKLAIPDAILKKKGGLTPGEREVIKRHTTLGADIFQGSRSQLLKTAALISLTHHERFDGTGYPNGLKGVNIPVLGRIVGLADVFDALTAERPYKSAYSFEKALAIIEGESGKHFDPKVVKAFVGCKKKIKSILLATREVDSFVNEI